MCGGIYLDFLDSRRYFQICKLFRGIHIFEDFFGIFYEILRDFGLICPSGNPNPLMKNIKFALQDVHTSLTETYGIPVWASFVIFGIIVILLGLLLGMVSAGIYFQETRLFLR